jgi:integrase
VSPRPIQRIQIWSVQDRRKNPHAKKPWIVRWAVDGESFSRSFRTKSEADRFRSRLHVAQQDGERFDARTGEPESWSPAPDDVRVHEWARLWVAQQWPEWAPRTRRSDVEALARFLPHASNPDAPSPPAGLRKYLTETLVPDRKLDEESECERWLGRWALPLSDLNREMLAEVERKLGIGDRRQTLAAQTAGRYRKVAHACIRRAVELGRLDADPWPPPPKGRNRRKAVKKREDVDVRRLPDIEAMTAIIQGIRSHQPGSRKYQVMTAIMYFAGLRPSEVVMLRPRALSLPKRGWGAIEVVEADIDWDEPGDPKTGDRTVPIPPELVELLRSWIEEHELAAGKLLFRTRNDRRPTQSNWGRALKRSCANVGRPPMRVYDCRHACATSWLQAGVPLGETARWLGHSVETLVRVYVGALEGDDTQARQRIDTAFAGRRKWLPDLGCTNSGRHRTSH